MTDLAPETSPSGLKVRKMNTSNPQGNPAPNSPQRLEAIGLTLLQRYVALDIFNALTHYDEIQAESDGFGTNTARAFLELVTDIASAGRG